MYYQRIPEIGGSTVPGKRKPKGRPARRTNRKPRPTKARRGVSPIYVTVSPETLARACIALESYPELKPPGTLRIILEKAISRFIKDTPRMTQKEALNYLYNMGLPIKRLILDCLTPAEREEAHVKTYMAVQEFVPFGGEARPKLPPVEEELSFYDKLYGDPPLPPTTPDDAEEGEGEEPEQ